MTKRHGKVWEERHTRDWFWIEKKTDRYFSSGAITCADAVRIIKGRRCPPPTCYEVKDIERFEPVSKGVIRLLAKTLDSRTED
jgi:hypothetical protein